MFLWLWGTELLPPARRIYTDMAVRDHHYIAGIKVKRAAVYSRPRPLWGNLPPQQIFAVKPGSVLASPGSQT